jgi:hypothetical protein
MTRLRKLASYWKIPSLFVVAPFLLASVRLAGSTPLRNPPGQVPGELPQGLQTLDHHGVPEWRLSTRPHEAGAACLYFVVAVRTPYVPVSRVVSPSFAVVSLLHLHTSLCFSVGSI